jgi:hypothetical protein
MLYKQGDEEILYAKHYMLMISHAERNIIVDTATEKYNAAPLYFLNIDTLISSYKSITYANVDGKKTYSIVPLHGDVNMFTLTLNNQGVLERITLTLSPEAGGGKAIISYSQFTANPVFGAEEFSPGRYVKRSGKNFLPQEAYKNYIIDTAINS